MSRTRVFFSRWHNWLSIILISGFFFVALAAPLLSPHNPKKPGPFMRVGNAFEASPIPPDENALLGQLPFGIDVFHALVWGSRDALQFGLIVTISTDEPSMVALATGPSSSTTVSSSSNAPSFW